MKINFKKVVVFTDITKTTTTTKDARSEFANILYTDWNGLIAHSLSLRIYESDGEIEISEKEAEFIKNVAGARCMPSFYDGICKQLTGE